MEILAFILSLMARDGLSGDISAAIAAYIDEHPEAFKNAVQFVEQTLTDSQQSQARDNIGAAAENDVADLKSIIALQEENIPDTTQTIAFDASGNVSSITHKDGSNNTVRTDAFTFSGNTITEARTLSTGESLVIVTNTDTLVTTVTYASA